MSRISTHILDTSRGVPAAGITVSLFQAEHLLQSAATDADGRCTNLLEPGVDLQPGIYRLTFDVGHYFADGFYPEVNVTFKISAGLMHYHVPLLISPYGYTTYRGS
jgi:5-hydroxyisourate hydrolase